MLTRDDVIRITESVIKDLRIHVTRGGFTDPNSWRVELRYQDELIDTDYFDVVQKDEYNG